MMKNKDVEYAYFMKNHFGGTVFAKALFIGIRFNETDIKYIETKMQTHKLYRLISGRAGGIKPSKHKKLFDFERIWLNSFLDDPDIPFGIRTFITYYIGHEWAQMKIGDKADNEEVAEKDKGHRYKDSIEYEFLAQRWMETCR